MKQIPEKYRWLLREPAPAILLEGLRHYGKMERQAGKITADIHNWSKEIGVNGWYPEDDFPWCGMFVAILVKRAGYKLPAGVLSAKNWLNFGTHIPISEAKLSDILVFHRPGGGHVGLYVGENKDNFSVYGGNQSDAVGFAWIAKARCIGARRCPWKVAQPPNIRKIKLTFTGEISTNEA